MEARTLGDFLRRIAIDYVRHGWFRYAVRTIPQGKDMLTIDAKMKAIYGVTSCRMTRMRCRKKGIASVQYLRFGHAFVLLATEGHQDALGRITMRDIRESPLHFGGYSVGLARGTVVVEVERRVWQEARTKLQNMSLIGKEPLEKALASLPFYRFPGVVRQKLELLRAINLKRKAAGLPLLAIEASQVFPPPPAGNRPYLRKSRCG
ncbi:MULTISPECIES: hypothetical protein [Cyanophyceae]|uniref:hypothetical protein n=1 Tax=Cyanophyceae TaxID=3028117 RepID=UPI0016878FAF|nr:MULTISPECIES: hypothetical protein [Cyanophyceae]MBD1919463.1 hypothetical protein [Phormidium sp. FACHB-77]MBD2054315.1 hypothetical protein [Leptolyngbya sp. FACHB-60]